LKPNQLRTLAYVGELFDMQAHSGTEQKKPFLTQFDVVKIRSSSLLETIK